MSRSVSLHKTTPSFSDVFKNSSGSAMFFFGELSTPSDINHVTVCSSGFIAPQNDHCLSTHCQKKKTGGLFRINMQLTSALLLEVKKEAVGEGRTTLSIRKTDDHPYWQIGTSTIDRTGVFFLSKVAHAFRGHSLSY